MLYHIVLPLHFFISFILHNIPIGYQIFSITELHLYNVYTFKAKHTKFKNKNFNYTVMSYK